jgi:hypothetical protein
VKEKHFFNSDPEENWPGKKEGERGRGEAKQRKMKEKKIMIILQRHFAGKKSNRIATSIFLSLEIYL